MSKTFDATDYPIAQTVPRRLKGESFWNMHIPFAFALTEMVRPRVFVELGTHRGESYSAFCQAVEALGLDTKCYAVDSWAGDVHTGGYREDVFEDLKAHHDPLYGGFSTLIRGFFDEALDRFDDGSIDLLHIDGTHTYEAVRHDFDSWRPKLSERGVVLMHDVAEFRQGFGVWKVWEEIKANHPHFEFPYGSGLGIAAIGEEVPEPVRALADDGGHAPATIHYFSMLGERVQAMAEARRRNGRAAPGTAESEAPAGASEEGVELARQAPRLLAFYLPQFHPVPENDLWWGKGFTEWSNVVQARPLFPGHDQPHVPADLGFYDLRLPEARQAQADLAAEYGISGFVYYHYWFGGRRILERPLDEMLASGEPDFPFALCWANASWTMHWHSGKPDRLVEQEYGEEDDKEHIGWLLDVFQDERYIKIEGRPLLLVYRLQDLPDPRKTVAMWKEEANRRGLPEPYVCKVEAVGDFTDPREMGCDAAVEFPPHQIESPIRPLRGGEAFYTENRIFSYEERIEGHLARPAPDFRRFPTVMPSFDNTPRHRGGDATIYQGATPELYERWLTGAIEKTSANPPEERIVFVNAWNEWAEGNHLEPDLERGRGYLEATKRALEVSGVEVAPRRRSAAAPGAALGLEERYDNLLNKYTTLQRRLTEHLRAEESTVLPLRLREYYEGIEKRHKDLRGRHARQTERFEDLKRRFDDLRARGEIAGSKEHTKLVRWLEQLDEDVTALLASQRWRLGSAVSEASRRILRKPRVPTAEDGLNKTLEQYRAWRQNRVKKDRKGDKEEG